jgi:hypothetical protein
VIVKSVGTSEVRLPEPNGSVCPLSQTAKPRYSIFMMNDPTTYVSPLTNVTYTIVKSYSERGSWDTEGNYAPVTVKQYSIYDGDKMVQFAFDEATIANAVRHYEQPGFDGVHSSWID